MQFLPLPPLKKNFLPVSILVPLKETFKGTFSVTLVKKLLGVSELQVQAYAAADQVCLLPKVQVCLLLKVLI